MSVNPYEMRFSHNFFFDVDNGTHTNTVISSGVLKTDGGGTGTWVSDVLVLGSNLDEVYLFLFGSVLSGAVISVSGDNGVNYQTVDNKEKVVVSSAKGKNLKVKVVFSSASTEIDSLSLLYKLE